MACVLAACLMLPAHAADNNLLSAEEVQTLLSGNTITGRYSNGNAYSEWHAPDGRVYGQNNRRPVENGCWAMRGNTACYYYAENRERGPFCWTFRRLPNNGLRATMVGGNSWEIFGIMQPGNPHGHNDNGKPWTCEPLSSEKQVPPPTERHAQR
jgi:opacity protein-like surface antigen